MTAATIWWQITCESDFVQPRDAARRPSFRQLRRWQLRQLPFSVLNIEKSAEFGNFAVHSRKGGAHLRVAEINDTPLAVLIDIEVGETNIAVNDAGLVDCLHSCKDFLQNDTRVDIFMDKILGDNLNLNDIVRGRHRWRVESGWICRGGGFKHLPLMV